LTVSEKVASQGLDLSVNYLSHTRPIVTYQAAPRDPENVITSTRIFVGRLVSSEDFKDLPKSKSVWQGELRCFG
jgi:hypothetical protein